MIICVNVVVTVSMRAMVWMNTIQNHNCKPQP